MKIVVLSICAAIGLLWSAGANADTITATYTGVVRNIEDPTGMFGSVMLGDTWIATYVFDTSLGITGVTSTSTSIYGGTGFGVSSPLVNVSLDIDQTSSYTIPSGFNDQINSSSTPSFSSQDSIATQANSLVGPYIQLENYVITLNSNLPNAIGGPINYNVQQGDETDGDYIIHAENGVGGGCCIESRIQATLTNVTVSSSPVPEPSSFSVLGGILSFLLFSAAAAKFTVCSNADRETPQ